MHQQFCASPQYMWLFRIKQPRTKKSHIDHRTEPPTRNKCLLTLKELWTIGCGLSLIMQLSQRLVYLPQYCYFYILISLGPFSMSFQELYEGRQCAMLIQTCNPHGYWPCPLAVREREQRGGGEEENIECGAELGDWMRVCGGRGLQGWRKRGGERRLNWEGGWGRGEKEVGWERRETVGANRESGSSGLKEAQGVVYCHSSWQPLTQSDRQLTSQSGCQHFHKS